MLYGICSSCNAVQASEANFTSGVITGVLVVARQY